MTAALVTIVVAWTVTEAVVVRARRTDLGERPVLREQTAARTVLWLNKGTAADVENAERWAKAEGYRVFTYPTSTRDPRALAARAVLR